MPAELQSAFLMKSLSDYFYLFFFSSYTQQGTMAMKFPIFFSSKAASLNKRKKLLHMALLNPTVHSNGQERKAIQPSGTLTHNCSEAMNHTSSPSSCMLSDWLSSFTALLYIDNYQSQTSNIPHLHVFFFFLPDSTYFQDRYWISYSTF